MIGPLRSGCSRHRPALLDFADHRDAAAVDAASLEHLDRCPMCRREVEAAALTAVALRRLAVEVKQAEPSADDWAEVRDRVAIGPEGHRATPGRAVGSVLAMLIVASVALVSPAGPLGRPRVTTPVDSVLAGADRIELTSVPLVVRRTADTDAPSAQPAAWAPPSSRLVQDADGSIDSRPALAPAGAPSPRMSAR